jgi:hypothetical protein
MAKKQRDRGLADQKESADEATQDRIKQYQRERDDATRNYQTRLRDQQIQFVRELQQQQQAGQQRLSYSAQLEARLTQLKAQYAQIDAEQERAQRMTNLQNKLAELQLEGEQSAQAMISPFKTAAEQAASYISQILSGATGGSTSSASHGTARAQVTSFADGGIATRPTFAIVGDKPGYAEAMIPFRRSEGIGAALNRMGNGGSPVTVSFAGATFTGGADRATLDRWGNEIVTRVAGAIKIAHGATP